MIIILLTAMFPPVCTVLVLYCELQWERGVALKPDIPTYLNPATREKNTFISAWFIFGNLGAPFASFG
jgi:hypothetical protein